MTEKEKMLAGLPYYADLDAELVAERQACKELCRDYNDLRPSQMAERTDLLKRLLGRTGQQLQVEQPLHCDYGYNIEVGENFFANFNLVILDAAKVTFGNNVFIGPNGAFYTAIHPIDPAKRAEGLETAEPISVGNNVWFGGNVTVLPGVTIGDNCVIGAGSVVTKDIPAGSIAVGNPCRVIKQVP